MGVMPDKDVRTGPRTDEISHEPLAYMYNFKGSSVVIDATFRSKKGMNWNKEGSPLVNKVSRELMVRVKSRWKEYGLT